MSSVGIATVAHPGALVGPADQAEPLALGVDPLGAVADRIPDDRHQGAEQVGDARPGRAHPAAVIGSPVTSSTSSTTVRLGNASWTRTSSPGTGAADQPGVDRRVPERGDGRLREGPGQDRPQVVEEDVAGEEHQLDASRWTWPALARCISATALSFIGSPASTSTPKLAIRSATYSSGAGAADGQADVLHRGVVQRVLDVEEAAVEFAGAEQVRHPVPRLQPGLDHARAERGHRVGVLGARPRGELRRAGGAAGLVHARVGQRSGQQPVVRPRVRRPERGLVDDRELGDVRDGPRHVAVQLARRTASACGRSRPAPATTSRARVFCGCPHRSGRADPGAGEGLHGRAVPVGQLLVQVLGDPPVVGTRNGGRSASRVRTTTSATSCAFWPAASQPWPVTHSM